MIDGNFEYISALQYRNKFLSERVRAFETEEAYAQLKLENQKLVSALNKTIDKLKAELADADRAIIKNRENWMQVFDDLTSEHEKELGKMRRELIAAVERAFAAERMCADAKSELVEKIKEIYAVKTELEEEKGKSSKLVAQIKRDYETSSQSSSLKPNHKKISNSREKTGKAQGGQPGHEGHPRRMREPTQRILIPVPEIYANNPDYVLTGNIIVKQLHGLRVMLDVTEYSTPEFRNIHTGQHVHADFPDGLVNEVTYDSNVKALAFLLNNYCCVSVEKVRELLSDLTGGDLQISHGCLVSLTEQFAKKSESERKSDIAGLYLSPVMHTDFTNVRINGSQKQINVCATPDIAVFTLRDHKGHKGVKGTPLEDYQGTVVHDHDLTFYNYGRAHQECLAHIIRYLKDSIVNEPKLSWNKLMLTLIQEMIHYRNSLRSDEPLDDAAVNAFEARYLEILDTADIEYEYEPPSKYYKDGYNLSLRLREFKDDHLLFLHDKQVPATNNLAERLLRSVKRKAKQVISFRSDVNVGYLCADLGVLTSLKAREENLLSGLSALFK